jgi:hypothetical protein
MSVTKRGRCRPPGYRGRGGPRPGRCDMGSGNLTGGAGTIPGFAPEQRQQGGAVNATANRGAQVLRPSCPPSWPSCTGRGSPGGGSPPNWKSDPPGTSHEHQVTPGVLGAIPFAERLLPGGGARPCNVSCVLFLVPREPGEPHRPPLLEAEPLLEAQGRTPWHCPTCSRRFPIPLVYIQQGDEESPLMDQLIRGGPQPRAIRHRHAADAAAGTGTETCLRRAPRANGNSYKDRLGGGT